MGLDMYLEARKYVSKKDYKSVPRDTLYEDIPTTLEYDRIAKFFPEGADEFGEHSGAEAKLTVAYWRKSNQIHNWFVENCGGGVDECQPIHVRPDQLRELRATIEYVLETKDTEKLAPTAGFFFGSTEVDEWYWEDLARTKTMLDKIIPMAEDEEWSLTYQASW